MSDNDLIRRGDALKVAALVEALEALIQQTYDCEKELTEDLHHMDFCGESDPLTKALVMQPKKTLSKRQS